MAKRKAKRGPTDATIRNIRASRAAEAAIIGLIVALEVRVRAIEDIHVGHL